MKNEGHSTKKAYNFSKANWDMFKRILPENIETNLIDDVEGLNNFITRSLLQAADLSIPIKYKN